MPAEIVRANDTLEPFVAELHKRDLYQILIDEEVTIDFLLVYAERNDDGSKKGPALKHQGTPALGVCRIVNYRDRVKGMADVEISLDGDWWEDHTTTREQRLALLDHEMNHIKITGHRDQAGRPKIKIRPHDFEVGFFHAVAERWGPDSCEVRAAQDLVKGKRKAVYFDHQPELFDKVVGINS